MTSNILHHMRDLQIKWRQQDFSFDKSQTEEYDILVAARRQVVRGFYAENRVFKGSKASADKIRDEEEKANPVEVEDEEY
jgi:hypothetical protein